MAVVDLHEPQAAAVFAGQLLFEDARKGYTGFDGPDYSSASPCHASREATAVDAIVVLIVAD
jgi:hypothetical protein